MLATYVGGPCDGHREQVTRTPAVVERAHSDTARDSQHPALTGGESDTAERYVLIARSGGQAQYMHHRLALGLQRQRQDGGT